MKIAILGAGAMGSLFGGLLAESGQDVTLLDINDAHLQAIRATGLRLETDSGNRLVSGLSACRPEQASIQPDLLLVFTKSLSTAAALAGTAGLIGPRTLLLTLQNGLGNVEAVSRFVAREQVLIGMTTWPADLVGPGHVHSHGLGVIRIMAADQREREDVKQVAAILSAAGLCCTADQAVWKAIWEKVAFNAALNTLCAVTGCTVDQLGAAPEGMALASAIIGEVVAVAQAEGIDADAAHCRETVAHAIAHHVGHEPSMLQDVLAGRATEVGAINGAVVEKGRHHRVATPHTQTLLMLVRLMEAKAQATRV
ncbi:2-dehydropantoate 2-reductase [Rhodoferax koreense]|uniref:2-dehydropantoate 2-reductase n=1 Tax=Rhodoferax koreensis TaxID=1842727 RepID=A0A1P8JYD9_9BURK|nr:2-dehydropantoate 2-reductase [Rhodoferax koreense]APW38773.1 2-dehydropantoate 2-reductase [Rhodoferax koreense]